MLKLKLASFACAVGRLRLLIVLSLLIISTGSIYFYTSIYGLIKGTDTNVLSPVDQAKKSIKELVPAQLKLFKHSFDETKPMNILLLGIDRRSRAENGYRTDIMILMTINPQKKVVVLTSVPRDLWIGGGRVNALYIQSGWDGMQSKFEQITGQKPDKFILTDFKDFSWVVDAMSGVTVAVEKTFTDYEYPVDATKGYQTVTFVEGQEKLNGDRALIFARSRHGNNGEGSDWMRMKRQHSILKGMRNAIIQMGSIFNPMVIEKAFDTVTNGKMDTNLTLDDVRYLWNIYQEKDLYIIKSLFMDSAYLYNPPMSEYGGAWVLVPKNKDYSAFHQVVNDAINNIEPVLESTQSAR